MIGKGHKKGKKFTKGILLELKCQKCGTAFKVHPYRKEAKFCSITCARIGAERPKKGLTKSCEICQKSFYIPQSHSYRRFCGKICSDIYAKSAHKIPPNFKKEGVGYRALHRWVEQHLGRPNKCIQCGIIGYGRKMHWANKSQNYQRLISDWIRLCPSCHKMYDRKPIARSK